MGRDSLGSTRPVQRPAGIRWILEWFIVLSAWLTAGGWVLSAVGQLNSTGYLVWLGSFAIVGLAAVRTGLLHASPLIHHREFRWPRRWPMRLFACLLLATLAGAISQRIAHFDALSYRIPRILQYLAENRWHWIRTTEFRMNAVAPGIEWLWSPIIALGGPERLINVLGSCYYLFLPGLLFGTWVQSGVPTRTAWWWCWIVPAGYCYAMQSGGPAVDLPGTIYTLAAIDFALRAWRLSSWRHLCLSVLAVSLMGTMRLMCLPIGLVWAGPAVLSLVRRRPPLPASLGTAALGLACSMLPGAYFNYKYAGSFRGIPTDAYPAIKHPLVAIVPNFAWYLIQNVVPPFFPWYNKWNQWANAFTASMGDRFAGLPFWGTVERGASEQNAGLGCTVFLFALLSIALARKYRPGRRARSTPMDRWIWVTPWIALIVFAAQIGLAQSGRYLASYYPLLLTPFLALPGFGTLTRRVWWQRCASIIIIISLGLVLVSRQRPVWPVYPLVKTAARLQPGNQAIQQVEASFNRLRDRDQIRAMINAHLPLTAPCVGYIGVAGSSDLDLAGPLHKRRVWRMDGTESTDWLRSRNVRYVMFEEWNPTAPEHPTSSSEWLQKMGGGAELARFTSTYSMSDHADIVLLDLGLHQ